LILNNKLLTSISTFTDTYVDCVKFYEKVKLQYYMSKFDPIKDFNIEFIFRQLPTVFQVIDNEKIGSVSLLQSQVEFIFYSPRL
jgi:dimeric dUTPase (all-alpha-NTP-PPase superfamily)